MRGPMDESVALARKLLSEPELFVYDQGMFWCGATLILVYAEEPDALDLWDRIFADVYRGGSLFVALTANLWGGYTAMLWGRLDEAWERFESASEQGMLWGAGERIDHVPAAFITQILVERGELGPARGALELARDQDPARGHFAGNLWRRAEVELLTAEGRLEEALAAVDALAAAIGRLDNPAGHPWRTLKAEILDRLGRLDEAAQLAGQELELARRISSRRRGGQAPG